MVKWTNEKVNLENLINRSRIYLYPLWKKYYDINQFPVACLAGINKAEEIIVVYDKPFSHKDCKQEIIIDQNLTGYRFDLEMVNFDNFVKGKWSELLLSKEYIKVYKNETVKWILQKDKRALPQLIKTISESFYRGKIDKNLEDLIKESYTEYDLPPNLNIELWNYKII